MAGTIDRMLPLGRPLLDMKPNVYTLFAATLLTLFLSTSTFAQQANVTVNQDQKSHKCWD